MKTCTILGCILIVLSVYGLLSETFQNDNETKQEQQSNIIHVSDYYYEQTIDTIKKYEGFKPEPYRCLVGQSTIGYGHVNRENLTHVSIKQADSILRSDLDYYIIRANKRTSTDKNKCLAIAVMMFSMGESRFCKTSIYKQVLAGDVSIPFQNYCFINKKKNLRREKLLIFVKHLYESH